MLSDDTKQTARSIAEGLADFAIEVLEASQNMKLVERVNTLDNRDGVTASIENTSTTSDEDIHITVNISPFASGLDEDEEFLRAFRQVRRTADARDDVTLDESLNLGIDALFDTFFPE